MSLFPALRRVLARVDGDAIDRNDQVPPRVIADLKRLGAFRLRASRKDGGLGLTLADYHRVVALIAEKSAGLSMWVTTHNGLGMHFLPPGADGLFAFAMSEEQAGTDPNMIRTTAKRVPGGYRLDGKKIWVTNGSVARWVAVIAKAPKGMTCFLVDARAKGVSVERRCRFLGLRGMENAVLRFKGVVVPESSRIGEEGEGLRLGLTAMNTGRLSVAPRALGIARECLRISKEWTSRRRQHGRALSRNASVAERLRRLEAIVSRLDSVSARTAQWADQGRDLRLESVLAKLFASSAAYEAADIALQLRGGRGYETADSQRARGEKPEPVERLLRDARGLRLIEGTDDVLRSLLARRIREKSGRKGEPDAGDYARADAQVQAFAAGR
ncbi:MAG: acyl-CoA/acyl-ACP dehydrogenase [Elusimicrobia bacterium]|nr:acyl-CoA/acyl-ACP dehydrogenase [Elusimicrobiota bacterium]